MNSIQATNLAICKALGIDPKVKAFELHCQADAPPTLRITSFMLDAHGVSEETQGFDITLREGNEDARIAVQTKADPFDLDKACEDALESP